MSPIDVKVYVTVDPFGSDILGVSTCGVKKGAGPLGWTILASQTDVCHLTTNVSKT